MKVVIFGAGISGLTIAHELLNLNYDVSIYEKQNEIGGMARSERTLDGMPTEHSWRGYAPFYENVYNIMKQLPTSYNKTIYDELSEPIRFILPKDKRSDKVSAGLMDYIILLYYGLKVVTSNLRNERYSKINFSEEIGKTLSQSGKDTVVKMLGPGTGLDQYKASLYHVMKPHQSTISSFTHHFHPYFKHKLHIGLGGWRVLKQPTNEGWLNPWAKYLVKKGLKIYLNSNLEKVNVTNNQITSCQVNQQHVHGDFYVIAIDPFSLNDIIEKTPLLKRDNNLNKIKDLIQDGPNDMISFRIAFDESIKLPNKRDVIAFPDSEFNITLYPQEHFFHKDVHLGDNIKDYGQELYVLLTILVNYLSYQQIDYQSHNLWKKFYIKFTDLNIYMISFINTIIKG